MAIKSDSPPRAQPNHGGFSAVFGGRLVDRSLDGSDAADFDDGAAGISLAHDDVDDGEEIGRRPSSSGGGGGGGGGGEREASEQRPPSPRRRDFWAWCTLATDLAAVAGGDHASDRNSAIRNAPHNVVKGMQAMPEDGAALARGLQALASMCGRGGAVALGCIAESDVVPMSLDAMDEHCEDEGVQRWGLRALSALVKAGASVEEALSEGALPAAIRAMRLLLRDALVQQAGCKLLSELFEGDTEDLLPVAADSLQCVLAAMERHEGLVGAAGDECFESACWAMNAIICDEVVLTESRLLNREVAKRAMRLVARGLDEHAASFEASWAACQLLGNCAVTNESMKHHIASEGGVQAVVVAMREHRMRKVRSDARGGRLFPQVEYYGCWLIGQLADNSPTNATLIAESGGIPAVVLAMSDHEEEEEVQQEGCRAICALTAESTENQSAIAAAGGIEIVVAAMCSHPENAVVCEAGCKALGCLAFEHRANTLRCVANGGVSAVTDAMQSFTLQPEAEEEELEDGVLPTTAIQNFGAWTLLQFVLSKEGARRMRVGKTHEAVRAVLEPLLRAVTQGAATDWAEEISERLGDRSSGVPALRVANFDTRTTRGGGQSSGRSSARSLRSDRSDEYGREPAETSFLSAAGGRPQWNS